MDDRLVAFLQRVKFHEKCKQVGYQTYPCTDANVPDGLMKLIPVLRDEPCVVGRTEESPLPATVSRGAFYVCLTPDNTFRVELLSKSNSLFVRKYSCTSPSELDGWCPVSPAQFLQNGDFIRLDQTTIGEPDEHRTTYRFHIRQVRVSSSFRSRCRKTLRGATKFQRRCEQAMDVGI